MTVKIKEPIWKPPRSVGIANKTIVMCEADDFLVEILYKNRFGDRIFPYPYRITKEKALSYPIQKRYGVELRIIPLKDMQEIHYAVC